MALWKKKVNGWPPDDPPKGNGTTIKGIETFGDREKKSYKDSLSLYKMSNEFIDNNNQLARNFENWRNFGNYANGVHWNITPEQDIEYKKFETIAENLNKVRGNLDKNMFSIVDKTGIKQSEDRNALSLDDASKNITLKLFRKPTGNGLIPQLSKMPIIKPEVQSSLIKFRPPTPLPEGNVELQNTGYTTVGVKKKPDGTRFIYDRSGKTDKTVIIDDNRIGFEYYIKKLYE